MIGLRPIQAAAATRSDPGRRSAACQRTEQPDVAGSANTAGGAAVASDEDSEELDRIAGEVEWKDCTKSGKTLLCHHCQARVDGGGRRHDYYYCWPCFSTVNSVRRFLEKGARVDREGNARASARETREQFEGIWAREGDGQEMCSIAGNTLVWSAAMYPGLTTAVTVLNECMIEIELEINGAHVKHCAWLESDAKSGRRLLQWSHGETWVETPGKLTVGDRLLVWCAPGPDCRGPRAGSPPHPRREDCEGDHGGVPPRPRGVASRKKERGSSGGDATQVPNAPGAPQAPPRSRARLADHLRHLALLKQRASAIPATATARERGAGSGEPVGNDAPQQVKGEERTSARFVGPPPAEMKRAREKGGAGDAGCQPVESSPPKEETARKFIASCLIISLLKKMERARKTKNDSAAHVDVVEMLDRAGLSHVHDRSKDWTALHHAVEECKRQKTNAPHLVAVVAKVLAANPTLIGDKTQGPRPPQNTALHLASKGHYLDAKKVVGMLLEARADPAAVDDRQCTPIMMAASTANKGAFEVLLEALDDATAKARNIDGRDAPPID